MVLPLPSAEQLFPAGGRLLNALTALDAARSGQLANQGQEVKNAFLPLTTQAEAASKLAYANLMGPQFLAKLLGNQDVLANMANAKNAINQVTQAATGQNAQIPVIPNMPQNPLGTGLLGMLYNKIFGAPKQNAIAQPATQNYINPLANQVPGSSVNVPAGSVFQTPNGLMVRNPQTGEITPLKRSQPVNQDVLSDNYQPNVYNQGAVPSTQEAPQGNKSVAETSGEFAGIKEEGKEAGKIRAQDIKELGDIYQNTQNKLSTLNRLTKTVNSPVFEQIRQLPILQQHELSWYSKFGTPEQKRVIGNFIDESGNIVRDFSADFKGAFRKGEQALVTSMKPNANDTIDVVKGKIESLMNLATILQQRTSYTADLMRTKHIDKQSALEQADKKLNLDQIKTQIEQQVNPKVQVRDKNNPKQVKWVTLSEARKMGVEGV